MRILVHKKMKRCLDCLLAHGPTTGDPAPWAELGQGMRVIITHRVTGIPPWSSDLVPRCEVLGTPLTATVI